MSRETPHTVLLEFSPSGGTAHDTAIHEADLLPEDVAKRLARYVLGADVRRAARIREGRDTRLRIEVLNSNTLTTGAPHQHSSLASIVRPCLEPAPDLSHLFPYQRVGAEWLAGRESALLADEMGLGKTIQAISALRILVHRALAFRVLVACPKSLTRNWRSEFSHWAPELNVAVLSTIEPPFASAWQQVFALNHVAVVNYDKLRTEELANSANVDILIADEAHKIRNIGAAISQGIRSVTTARRWGLTGTPIERDVEDFAALLAFLDSVRFSLDDRKHPIALRNRAKAYTLRRNRDAVLKEMPSIVQHRERIELSPSQRRAYDAELRNRRSAQRDYLALLGRLRQICDFDPSSGDSSKVERIVEVLGSVLQLNEKAIVFSYFLEPLRLLAQALRDEGLAERFEIFDGSLNADERVAVLERFSTHNSKAILLASTRVAGEGLTLTQANHVIFLNQWWNPSSNQQARDRVVRIGQERTVHVYVLTCENTVEENLENILEAKDETYRHMVDQLSSVGLAVSDDDLARAVIEGR